MKHSSVLKISLSALALNLAANTAWATVYKYIDENGIEHYTDSPSAEHSDAKKLDIEVSPAANSGPLIKSKHSSYNEQKKKSKDITISIRSPKNDEALRANDGKVNISGSSSRRLPTGTEYQLVLDGSIVKSQSSASFNLNNVQRGTHTAIIQIITRNGKVIAESEAVTFHILKAGLGG